MIDPDTTAPIVEPISNLNTNAGLTTTPTLPDQVQPFLNHIQQNYLITQGGTTTQTDPNFTSTNTVAAATSNLNADGTPKTSQQLADESMQDIVNLGSAPAPISLVDLYKQLRNEKGIADLENSVTSLMSMQQDTAARLRQRSYLERGKAVPMNVMQGRIGEIEMQERENMAFIDRQLTTKQLQLNSANNIISTMVSLTGQDYANTSQWFNAEFSRRMELHNAYEVDADKDRAISQSQLEIVTNMIMDGSLSWESLTPEQKLVYGKLEIAAGFAPGFLQTIKMKPGANIVTMSNRTYGGSNWTDIVTRQPDGSLKVESVKLGAVAMASSGGGSTRSSSGGGGTKDYTQTQINSGVSVIQDIVGDNKAMTSAEVQQLISRLGGDTELAYRAMEFNGNTEIGEENNSGGTDQNQLRTATKEINAALASYSSTTLRDALNKWQDIIGRDHPMIVDGWRVRNQLMQVNK